MGPGDDRAYRLRAGALGARLYAMGNAVLYVQQVNYQDETVRVHAHPHQGAMGLPDEPWSDFVFDIGHLTPAQIPHVGCSAYRKADVAPQTSSWLSYVPVGVSLAPRTHDGPLTGKRIGPPKCECGVDALGYGLHSDWCVKAARP